MRNIFNKLWVSVIGIFFIVGCNSDYFDVNTPYNAENEKNLAMDDLLAPTIYHTFMAQYYAERSFGNYTQYFTGQSGGALGQTSISGTWSEIYLYCLPNLTSLTKKAENLNAYHYKAVAQTLMALNLGLATDSWGAIPYLEATQGLKNFTPSFDTQETVYQAIDSLLSSAITLLEKPDTSIFKPDAKTDLVYQGDMDKWLKLAYTLRARYKLHLSQVNGNTDMASILSDISKGFTNNSDDFQLQFSEKNINPWYSREVLAKKTGNSHDKIGDQLVSYMNGTSYPYGTINMDPRLPIYSSKTVDSVATWRGYVSGGEGLSSDNSPANTDFSEDGFYTNEAAPLVILSYAEALFIKAEALFLSNGGTPTSIGTDVACYQSYKEGIRANMEKLGVAEVAIATYLSDTSIDVGSANLKLAHIMKEKYIANFLNPETYVDFRRYDFSTDVFKDLSLPADNATSEFPGEWLVRAVYPSSEQTGNPKNVSANKKAPTEPVWWDR